MENTKNMNYNSKIRIDCNEKTEELLDSLPSYCLRYINSIRLTTQPRTRLAYVQDLKVFFHFLKCKNPTLKDVPEKEIPLSVLDSLDQDDVIEYEEWLGSYELDGKRYSNDSTGIKRKLSSLRSFYHYLSTTKGMINNNPVVKVDMPVIHEKEIRTLDPDERVALFNTLNDEYEKAVSKITGEQPESATTKKDRLAPALIFRDITIIYLLLGTGMRVSELVGIDIGDIKLDMRRINIVRKGGKYDHVYISDDVADKVYEYINDFRVQIGALPEAENALLLSSKHQRLTTRSVERIVKKYVNMALGENNGITPHKLRSTFGTQYYRHTGDIYSTAAVMGHSSVETTRKHYAKVSENAKERMQEINIFGDN